MVVGASTQPPHQYPFLVSGLWDGEQVQLTEGCPDEHRLVVDGASFRNITITSVHGEQVQLTEDCPDEHGLDVEGHQLHQYHGLVPGLWDEEHVLPLE